MSPASRGQNLEPSNTVTLSNDWFSEILRSLKNICTNVYIFCHADTYNILAELMVLLSLESLKFKAALLLNGILLIGSVFSLRNDLFNKIQLLSLKIFII